jgi:hypothetical protein
MVDFWEVFGRLVTSDRFREDLYDAIPTGFDKVMSVDTGSRLDIPESKYTAARDQIATVMDGPVSLMSAGELVMCIEFQPFRDRTDLLAEQVGDTGVNTRRRRPIFYQALGLMLLDAPVLDLFAHGDFEDAQFGTLNARDRRDIKKIAKDKQVKSQANMLCALFWVPDCFDKLFFYTSTVKVDGRPRQRHHTHPLANPLPTL